MAILVPWFVVEQFQAGVRAGTLTAAALTCDVSGFMDLTEELLREEDGSAPASGLALTGEGGGAARRLAEGLDDLLAPLVAEVTARGGFIPAFAGDGFTALFPGEHAGASYQAAQAALVMQTAFSACGGGPIFAPRPDGLPLCLKVGLSHGRVEWGMPGHDGRFAYYFRGEAVAGSIKAEERAGAGEIVADERFLSRLEPRCDVRALDAGEAYWHLLACPPLPTPPAGRPAHVERSVQSPFVPQFLLESPPSAKFLDLCAIFLSFHDALEGARLDRLLESVLRLAEEARGIPGSVSFGPAGGLLPIWFSPVGSADPAERAAAFLRALRQDGGLEDVGIGWTAGRAWTGLLGGPERSEYTAIGDVVNLAARLASRADRGQIWASRAVYDRLRGSPDFVARGEQRVKGKRAPVAVYEWRAADHE